MNINVNNIIGTIESALKNVEEGSKESSLPRMIDPAFHSKKAPESSFRGKTLLGRWYVDAKGAPFRKISWYTQLYMPTLGQDGVWSPRTIRAMASNNYVGLKPDELELNRELNNLIRDISKDESLLPKYNGSPYVPGTPILTTSKEVVLLYFKPASIICNGVATNVPPLGPASYICSRKQGLLNKMLNAIQSENLMNSEGWINGVVSREGINNMNVLINMDLNSTGKGYEASFNFKSAKGVPLTQEDLDASQDLNNEFFPNIFDAERTIADIEYIKEQVKLRREGALKEFENVEAPEVSNIGSEEFKAVKTPTVSDSDIQSDDIPF